MAPDLHWPVGWGVGGGEALVSAEEHSAELRGTGHLETLCFRHQAT